MRLIKADGTIETVVLGNKKVTLAQLQAAVGGWIEAVPGTKCRAYCNEEGRLLSMPFNKMASERFNQMLVGDVVELEKGDRQ